jgi:hypothetical protein
MVAFTKEKILSYWLILVAATSFFGAELCFEKICLNFFEPDSK